jgi:hypothetical protein
MTTPPIAGETTTDGRNGARRDARAAPSAPARSGHWSTRAHCRYASEWRPEESLKWPDRSAPDSVN